MHAAPASERYGRLVALNAVLTVIARHSNLLLPRPFEELAATVGRFAPSQLFSVLIPEAEGELRAYAVCRSDTLSAAPFGARLPAPAPLVRRVFGEGQAFSCDDTRAGDALDGMGAAAGCFSYLALPVRSAPPPAEPGQPAAHTGPADGGGASRPVIAALVVGYGEASAAAAAPLALLEELAGALGAGLDRSLRVMAGEREAAERLLRIRELEELHRNLLDNAPLIIFRLDPETGDLSFLNRHAERLLGVPVAEALRTPGFLGEVHADPEGVMCFEDAVAQARLGAPSAPYEARLRRREGEAITARGTVYPLVSERGRVVAIEGVLADVSTEHAARTRLVQIDRLSTLGTLAAGVAHEINNPAAFILLGLDMLDRLLRGPNVRMEGAAATSSSELLKELRDSIKRIVDIVRDLKLFASPPQPEGSRRTLTDANRTVESALSLTRGQIIERAQIVKNLTEVPPIFMEDGRLGQVIVNLLVNAAQAIPKPSSKLEAREQTVTVETRSDGRTVEIVVTDTGAGIAEENLARIWAPFFTTKGPEFGTGLGLSISREIIERAGGRITAESPVPGSDPPCGARFVISLPAAGRAEEETPIASPLPRLVSKRARVLIVEDEASLARALSEQLGRVHQVTVAPSADAAMGMLAGGQRFDVVLCDLRMPGMSGDVFYTRIRESDPALAQGFIFMTGVGFGADIERFLASSGRPLLEKPFPAEDALSAIAEVVSANRTGAREGG
ncbi:two-component hybrid sensor and regulator [Sorangium cellulosum]|uniref:histidine kinase n=1 Tax=Sorangium cellulosum TaxID=56 RepID=A0A4P2Q358_SORCE|nr:hybrid sensor histidine kinase/response regulator [Sorangium cellulosum]AUX23755.1 two-component hybrid sensor and regulator [Sorangium cellulosum]